LPTPEDRLLFILVYLKTYPLQVVQGRSFGMGQSKAHQWIHVLLVVLQATLRALGDDPSRSFHPATAKLIATDVVHFFAVVVSAQDPEVQKLVPSPRCLPCESPTWKNLGE
jgi:Helix-turn-helix of DDE superfamily endonuclease